MFKPPFTDRSKAVHLLWIPFATYVSCCERADLLALLCVDFSCVFCHFHIWCPGSGVVLDCIDS